MKAVFAVVVGILGLSSLAHASDNTLLISCAGPDAKMEIYGPHLTLGVINSRTKTLGYYALDLTEAGKGKPLEPVLLSLTTDGKSLIVDQFTRGLPVTKILLTGATVNFDNRFGTAAVCQPIQ